MTTMDAASAGFQRFLVDNNDDADTYGTLIYDKVDFRLPGLLISQRAPHPIISILLGLFFIGCTLFTYQVRFRNNLRLLRESYDLGKGVWESTFTRTFLSALMDGDDATYTVMSNFAIQFLFLGGFQLSYTMTYQILMLVMGVTALGELIRIYLAYRQYDSLRDLVVTYKIRNKKEKMTLDNTNINQYNRAIVDYTPDNVYQNLSRNAAMITVVFLSQAILISFVVFDAMQKTRIKCFETGEKNCPVVGTLGSWLLFILGMLLQNVYLLGPNGGFGKSQQDPGFWLVALLSVKNDAGSSYSWKSVRGLASFGEQNVVIQCSKNDIRIWFRLLVDTIINGFGYRVLFHSLPILLASRPTVRLVVFIAIGVLYIARLDDAHGDQDIRIEEHEPIHYQEDGASAADIIITEGIPIEAHQNNISITLIMNNIYTDEKED